MNNNPIGVFDSGVGGLSVLLEIKKLLPNESSIFVADQAYVPYGAKTKEELIDRVGRILGFFKEKNVKAVVFACNTATVYTIDEMRKKFEFPIIGTVPVVKTIANLSKSGKTAVFSTPATAKSPYLQELIDKFASNVSVECVGGSNLEELVENGEIDSYETIEILKKHLLPLVKNRVDAIALGCTHYPFLREEIEKIVGPEVMIVDSGGAVARRLKQILTAENLLSNQNGSNLYYTTGNVEKFERVSGKLLGEKIEAEHISL
ncbi:MAG: glutamate racemase [Candidatus Levybacteria bacterium]|nr:glutamate racemase [Candidatus Levybacteria bacterium]